MSTLITDGALADEFGIDVERLHKLRRRYAWPHVRLGRKDIRFTPAQVEEIVRMHSEDAPSLPSSVAIAGQTKRSARRSA